MSNIDVESTIDVCLFEPHGHDSQQNDIFEEELKEPMYMKDEELYIATSPSFPIVRDSKNMMDIVREDAKNMMDMMEKETTPGGDFKEDEYLKTSDSFPIEVCQSWGSDYLQLNLDMSKAFFYVVSPAAADAKDSTTVTSETYDNLATTSSSLETKIVHYPQTEFSTTSSTNTSKDANKSSSTTTSSDQAGKTFENYQNDYPVSYIISDVKKDNEIIWKHVTAADYEQISEKGEVSLMKYDQSKMEQYSLQDAALEISSAPSPAQLVSTEHILGVTIPQVFCCLWEQCGHTSLTSADLIAHVNSEHIVSNDKQTYLCRWRGCVREGKAFNARYKMVTHLRTHTGEKPHVCPVEGCHQAFGRIENMKIHMRSHTGERPYPCLFEGCDKTFANSSDRFKHKRTHMEKKPFRCTVPGCDKQYTDPSTLRKHKRKHVVPPDILHPPSFVFT